MCSNEQEAPIASGSGPSCGCGDEEPLMDVTGDAEEEKTEEVEEGRTHKVYDMNENCLIGAKQSAVSLQKALVASDRSTTRA